MVHEMIVDTDDSGYNVIMTPIFGIQSGSPHCHSTYQNIKEVVLRGRLVASEKVQHLTLTPLTEFLHPIDKSVNITLLVFSDYGA